MQSSNTDAIPEKLASLAGSDLWIDLSQLPVTFDVPGVERDGDRLILFAVGACVYLSFLLLGSATLSSISFVPLAFLAVLIWKQGASAATSFARWFRRQRVTIDPTSVTLERVTQFNLGGKRAPARVVPLGQYHGVMQRRKFLGSNERRTSGLKSTGIQLRERHIVELYHTDPDLRVPLRISDTKKFTEAEIREFATQLGIDAIATLNASSEFETPVSSAPDPEATARSQDDARPAPASTPKPKYETPRIRIDERDVPEGVRLERLVERHKLRTRLSSDMFRFPQWALIALFLSLSTVWYLAAHYDYTITSVIMAVWTLCVAVELFWGWPTSNLVLFLEGRTLSIERDDRPLRFHLPDFSPVLERIERTTADRRRPSVRRRKKFPDFSPVVCEIKPGEISGISIEQGNGSNGRVLVVSRKDGDPIHINWRVDRKALAWVRDYLIIHTGLPR